MENNKISTINGITVGMVGINKSVEEILEKVRESNPLIDDEYLRRLLLLLNTESELPTLSDCLTSIETQFVNCTSELSPEEIKKKIKYSKNPMEIKRLNKLLNQAYKETK